MTKILNIMLSISITAKNGIAASGAMLINPENIILYKDNASSKAVIRYNADINGKDKPVNYTATISKAALDLLIPAQNSITILKVTEVNPSTGTGTAVSINESYVSKISSVKTTISRVLTDKLEIQYSDGGFIKERMFISEAANEIVYIYPGNANLGFITQDEADARYPQIVDGDPTPIYTKAEVDVLLLNKANTTTGIKYVAPAGITALGMSFAAGDAMVADIVYAAKFYIPFALTVNNFVFHITTEAAGGTVSWAVYNEAKNTKLVAAESVSAATPGVITSNVTATTLTPGWYWVAYSNSVNTIRVMALYSYGSAAFDADVKIQGTADNAAVSGVMPATLGVISTNYQKVPIVSLNN